MNESGSAYDLASGTNPIVDNCDDEEDIFLQPGSDIGQQLLDPPLSYWRASRCIYENDLQDQATQDEKFTRNNDLLT